MPSCFCCENSYVDESLDVLMCRLDDHYCKEVSFDYYGRVLVDGNEQVCEDFREEE